MTQWCIMRRQGSRRVNELYMHALQSRVSAFVLGISIALIAPFSASASTNLITNGTLETGSSFPSGWSRMYWGTPAPTFTYPVSGRTGRAAAISYTKDSTGDARWQPAAVNVESGATYTYTGWYASTAQTEVNVEYQTSRGTKSYTWLATFPSTGGVWKQASVSFTVPSGMVRATPFHLIDKQGVLTIDDISLVKNGTPTPTPEPEPTPTPTPTPQPGAFAEGMVTLSFDDAWTSQYVNALPTLESAGLRGTFYILTQPVQGGWSSYMTPNQVKDIASRGHDIEGHTVTHTDLTTLSTTRLDREIRDSRVYLQNLTGKPITSLAYPYGSHNTNVINRTKAAGYTSARSADPTTQYGFNTQTTSRFTINSFSPNTNVSMTQMKSAIDKAKNEKLWFVLSIHEVKVNGDLYAITPAQFSELVAYIKSSGIKVVTMAEGAAMLSN